MEQIKTGRKPTHGKWKSREWNSWEHAKRRCNNPKDPKYPLYGARGIKMCSRWQKSFQAFYDDMGERPEGKSLDRKGNNGHYSCGKCEECISNGWNSNCKWSTPKEQSNNTRRNLKNKAK